MKSFIDIPQISVLVPIYNVREYLEKCLESLRVQSFTDFEVICLNDGSTDGSREIIKRFVRIDKRFHVLDKENSGYGDTMNHGLDVARGTYIAILESDDFCKPDTLERLHAMIVAFDAEVVKANCELYWTGPPQKTADYELVPRKQTGRLIDPSRNQEIFYLPAAIWAGLYRREFLESHNIRFTTTPGASYQDTAFSFKIWANARRAVFLDKTFVYYRQDNEASSMKSAAKVFFVCTECDEMERYLAARKDTPAWLQEVRVKLKFNTYLWNYERLDASFQWEFLERFSREMKREEEAGYLNRELFDAWSKLELESILSSPEAYHKERLTSGRNRFGKALHFLKMGGPGLLLKIARSKIFGS